MSLILLSWWERAYIGCNNWEQYKNVYSNYLTKQKSDLFGLWSLREDSSEKVRLEFGLEEIGWI